MPKSISQNSCELLAGKGYLIGPLGQCGLAVLTYLGTTQLLRLAVHVLGVCLKETVSSCQGHWIHRGGLVSAALLAQQLPYVQVGLCTLPLVIDGGSIVAPGPGINQQ